MQTVTTTSVFPCCWDLSDAVVRLCAAGFRGLDLAFDYCVQKPEYPFMTDAYSKWAEDLRELAAAHGARFSHSHAPFDAHARGSIVRKTMECAQRMGIRYVVVHPIFCYEDRSSISDPEEFIRINAEAIQPILEEAARNNVTVLSENLLWGASIDFANIAALVKEVNSHCFGWCLDTGHAHAMGCALQNLEKVSLPPLSLHIQDTHGDGRDEHLIPGDGNIDWGAFLRTLKKAGYTGDLVLEAHHQSLELPDAERDGFLAMLCGRAEKMTAYYDSL